MLPVDSGFASQLKNLQKVHKHDDDDSDDDSDDDGEDNYGDDLQQWPYPLYVYQLSLLQC